MKPTQKQSRKTGGRKAVDSCTGGLCRAQALALTGIVTTPDDDVDTALKVAKTLLRKAGIDADDARLSVYKRSVDARVRHGERTVRLVHTVLVQFPEERGFSESRLAAISARPVSDAAFAMPECGSEDAGGRPLVVGMGPAGLFCALLLAEKGYRPIIIDRGDEVYARVKVKEHFMKTGELDVESNVQFGAGGAGAFSDGKLITRISDPLSGEVLRRLAEFGAPGEILTEARPHIGTDLLVEVVDRMLHKIEALGGTVLYRTRFCRILRAKEDRALVAVTTAGEIPCGMIVLALGHSARDTQEMLIAEGFPVIPKPFSVGVRVEHLQRDIDEAMYGDYAGHPRLGHAEYNLSDTNGDRGVYTFCMCPGGSVVAAASEEGGVVVNGMSEHARDGENAVAAVAVSVLCDDYGNTPMGGIAYQRSLERAAFRMGGGGYAAPIQTLGDFLAGECVHEPARIQPSYSRGVMRLSRLDELFPAEITESLRRGLTAFGRRVKGYDAPDAVLTGVETRTSSPVRMLRNEGMTAVGFSRVYPIGEGAGYAGGITSAAVDGIRAAMAIVGRFRPFMD